MRVALQPANLHNADVRQHYQDTIVNEVVFAEHEDLLSPDVMSDLNRLFPAGRARMWGVVPGKRNVNVGKVARLRASDFVLFYGGKKLYLAGTVALRWHNKALAERLWKTDENNQTWEHMYALQDVREIAVPVGEVQPLLGWQPTAVVQGFNIYQDAKADALSELCNLAPEDLVSTDDDDSSRKSAGDSDRPFEGSTDAERTTLVRREQPRLKRRLKQLGGGACALCGEQVPATFLVAAHIKKRSKCTDEEKVDFDNVGMLACLLGCDGLFEHGYIAVDHGGELLISDKVLASPVVKSFVESRLGNHRTSWWTESREPYFAWHRTHVFLRMM